MELPGLGSRPIKSVLCLGAHADDIEIGAGATLLKLLSELDGVEVHWVVLSADERRETEARASAEAFLKEAGGAQVSFGGFQESYFPYIGRDMKEYFDRLGSSVNPDIIFTHTRDDKHQDHRLVCELTWNTWRDRLILEYEIPKYDGDLGQPNFFVAIGDDLRERKVETLMSAFVSQTEKYWFTTDTFNGLMRLRGVESRSPTGYAEAFYVRKFLVE